MIESGPGISRRNLSQAVTEELLRLIGTGEIRPGERLPTERGLIQRYQVGRNTIREAVHALASQGLVDVRPGRGATVLAMSAGQALDNSVIAALLDDQAVSDLYDFRRLIEVEVAERAAERASERDVEDIAHYLGSYLHSYHERLPTWSEDVAFHRAVAAASHNVIYLEVLDLVNDKLLATRKETQRHATVLARAATEHLAVFEAIKAHDPERARTAMTQHIDSAVWALDQARQRLHESTGESSGHDSAHDSSFNGG